MSGKETTKRYLYLHGLLLFYSLASVCSKLAGQKSFLSAGFILFYGLVLLILFVYAIAWQQILKRFSLVGAYANKAVTVIWGLLWGFLIFRETITWKNIVGAVIIIVGIYLVVSENDAGS